MQTKMLSEKKNVCLLKKISASIAKVNDDERTNIPSGSSHFY